MPEAAVRYTPFGTPIRKTHGVKLSVKVVPQYGLEPDKETGSTKIVKKDPLDLYELTQSYKSLCGMELAQLQISRGLASPDDFAAKPGDYGDTSTLPDNINDAYQASLKAKSAAASQGVNLSQFKSDADIKAYVDKLVSAQLKAAEDAKAAQAAKAASNVEVK